jgi:2-methylcitrate dehydratase PrpD
MATNISASLGRFASNLRYEDLSGAVLSTARMGIADAIGCMFAGVKSAPATRVRALVAADGGSPDAAVLGTAIRLPAAAAALANGVACHSLDFDDINASMFGHPSAVIVPVVFALGEKIRASGKDVLCAYVAGFEVAARLGRILNPEHYSHGWHATSTLGALGAAIAAARMLQLDENRTRMALGIGASHAGGLRQNFGTDTKPLHAGMAARGGIVAAMLAQAGFTGNPDILGGTRGFFEIFTGSSFDIGNRLSEDGDPFAQDQPFEAERSGISIKRHACCGSTHTAIDALLHIMSERGVAAQEVAKIECQVNKLAPEILIHHHANTPLEGKFSMEYCLAVTLADGECGLTQFTQARVDDREVQRLSTLVDMKVDPELPVGEGVPSALVRVYMKSGQVFSHRVLEPKGSPADPLGTGDLQKKFINCASAQLQRNQIDAVWDMLANLDAVADVSDLPRLAATEFR